MGQSNLEKLEGMNESQLERQEEDSLLSMLLASRAMARPYLQVLV